MFEANDLIHYPIIRVLKLSFLESISKFYVYNNGQNALLIDRNDQVYGISLNKELLLGVGHRGQEPEPISIPRLCGKKIETIVHGTDFVLALTKNNELYEWSYAHKVGVTDGSMIHLKPKLVMENIQMIKCGDNHAAALDQNGIIWTWGENGINRWMNADLYTHSDRKPMLMKFFPKKIIYIECGSQNVLCITHDLQVWGWGNFTHCRQLIFFPIPTRFLFSHDDLHITQLAIVSHEIIFLTIDGNVYHCCHLEKNRFQTTLLVVKKPIACIITPSNGDMAILVSLVPSSQILFVLNKGINFGKVFPISITSVPDACCLYTSYSNTVVLAKLPSTALNPVPNYRFNGLFEDDLILMVYGKPIHVQRSIICNLSPYLCRELDNMVRFPSKENIIHITDYSFPVYFAYIKYLYTRTIQFELGWAFDMLVLAHDYREVEIRDKCVEYLKGQMSNKNLIEQYYDTRSENYRDILLDLIRLRIDVNNCCELFPMTHYHNMEEKLTKFVADFIAYYIHTVSVTAKFRDLGTCLRRKLLDYSAERIQQLPSIDYN